MLWNIRDLYKQRDETLTEPKNKLSRCYAKGNETCDPTRLRASRQILTAAILTKRDRDKAIEK